MRHKSNTKEKYYLLELPIVSPSHSPPLVEDPSHICPNYTKPIAHSTS